MVAEHESYFDEFEKGMNSRFFCVGTSVVVAAASVRLASTVGSCFEVGALSLLSTPLSIFGSPTCTWSLLISQSVRVQIYNCCCPQASDKTETVVKDG
jgi:hypothetical protein